MFNLFFEAFLVIILFQTILWLISIYITNASIVDIFWGSIYIVIELYYFFSSGDIYTRKLLMLILVIIWGFRLTIHLAVRNAGKGEDFRYKQFRQKYGHERYWWVSYFQVFLLQGAIAMIVSLPLMAVNVNTNLNSLNWLDYLAIILWITGFIFEAVGDYQLAVFKKKESNKGKVLRSGFWKYTRHPNYFGDSLIWWSYGLFAIASGTFWVLIGPFLMTLLLLKVSGVSLLEKTLKEEKTEYKDYIERTSPFLPWFPKNK